MDPFVFDQKFAKFVGQVDAVALAKGTELYEAGAARIDALGKDQIRGSVMEKREGAFQVQLASNEEGGLSGNCGCPEFFNCAHAYALARAARDRVLGASSNNKKRLKAEEKGPSSADRELGRVWKLAKQSGGLLYPMDLYKFVSDRRSLGVSGREPIRELKRALQREEPKSLQDFAAVLYGYFEHKGISLAPGYDQPKRSIRDRTQFEGARKGRNWDRPPLKLRVRIKLEESPDRDWFQARAVWDIQGERFSASEIEMLREADGNLVKLGEKGWYRLDCELPLEEERVLTTLGLDPGRGNSQRVHLCQIEDLLPHEIVEGFSWEAVRQRANHLRTKASPAVPGALSGVLRPYQLEGFSFLCRLSQLNFGGVLADDMGLGKTLQTIAWLLWLDQKKAGSIRALVVCPKSVTDNWVQEPVTFETGLNSILFQPGVEDFAGANIVVVNYTQLRLHADSFLEADWDAVILDEAQYIKSPTSQTSKIAYRLKGSNRLALTGTPIENSLTDLWSIMRFAMPRLLGPLPTFQVNYGATRGKESLLDLRRRMKPFLLRRLKGDVAKELPERIEKDIYCDLEGAQRALYDEELSSARMLLKSASGKGAGLNVLQALLRLRQVCCDTQLIKSTASREETELSAKVQALLDLIEPLVAEGHKVLVFSQFVRMLGIVDGELEARKIARLKLTGKTKDRGSMVKRFQQDSSEQVFLLSLKAAGSGLTLTAASYVVLLDPWWNPAVEAQAIDRAHRIGQTDQVIAYRILAKDTVEEKIRKIQQEKAELAAALFGEGGLDSDLGLDELQALLAD